MEDADTSIWPEKCVNLCLTNYLARKENAKTVEQLNNEEFIIIGGNSSKVVVAGTCKIKLPSNLNLSQRAKLPTILKNLGWCPISSSSQYECFYVNWNYRVYSFQY